MRFFCLAACLTAFFFLVGCWSDQEQTLKPEDFLDSLKEEGFQPVAIPQGQFPTLQGVAPDSKPIGVFEMDESKFAIYSKLSTKKQAADDQNGSLGIFVNENITLVANKKCDPKVIQSFQSLRPSLSLSLIHL